MTLRLIVVTGLIALASSLPVAPAGHAEPKVPAFGANVYGPPQSLHLHVIPTKQVHAAAAPAPYARAAPAPSGYAAVPAPRYAAPAPAAGRGATQFAAYNSLAKGNVRYQYRH